MILLQCGLLFALCLLIKAEDKQELGFTDSGAYNGKNDVHSSTAESLNANNNNERQDKAPAPEYSGGLTDYASVGSSAQSGDFNVQPHVNFQPGFYNYQLNSNPTISSNYDVTAQDSQTTLFDQGWIGRNTNNNGNFRNVQILGQVPFNGVTHKQIAQDVQQNGYFLDPLKYIEFSGVSYTNGIPEFRNAPFESAHSVLPSKNAAGIFGQALNFGGVQFNHGTQPHFGGYQNNQPIFGTTSTNAGLSQGNFAYDHSRFDQNAYDQSFSHPRVPVHNYADFQNPYNHYNDPQSNVGNQGFNLPAHTPTQGVPSGSAGSHGFANPSHSGQSPTQQNYLAEEEQHSAQAGNSVHNSANTQGGTVQGSVSSAHVTNGHAVGHAKSNERATSYQSFVIHSYKPTRVYVKKVAHKSSKDLHNSGEPNSPYGHHGQQEHRGQ